MGKMVASEADHGEYAREVETRGKWAHQMDFMMMNIGFAVGLGNIWRYPSLAYENGGFAFVFPYIVCVIILGLPLYCMEGFMGQLSGLGTSDAHGALAPLFRGVGWGQVIMTYSVSLYYNMIIGWVLLYLGETFRATLPWSSCNNTWNSYDYCFSKLDNDKCGVNMVFFNRTCKRLGDFENQTQSFSNSNDSTPQPKAYSKLSISSASEEFFNMYVLNYERVDSTAGELQPKLVVCLLVAWILVFLCIGFGLKATGKVAYFTALFPYIMLSIFLVYGASLSGAGEGIRFYLEPKFAKIFEFKVWHEAAVQVFFSLNPAMGGIITMSSHSRFHNNMARDAIIVCLVDSLTSMLAGCAVFASVGYLAHSLEKEVQDVLQGKNTLGLAFVAFPETISLMPGSHFWAFAFFIMLLMLGLGSQFVMVQTATIAFADSFPVLRTSKWHNLAFTGILCTFSFFVGLIFCTRNGFDMFNIINTFSVGYTTCLAAFLESVLIGYVYGVNNFITDISYALGYKLGCYWWAMWLVACPLASTILFAVLLSQSAPVKSFDAVLLPSTYQLFGWFMSLCTVFAIIGFGAYEVYKVKQNNLPWITLVMPTPRWNPEKRGEQSLYIRAQEMRLGTTYKGTQPPQPAKVSAATHTFASSQMKKSTSKSSKKVKSV